jgi:hypothetical protein
MALPDGMGEVKTGVVTYGIPLVGGLVGVVLAGTDVLGVTKFLTDLIPMTVGKMGMGILTAAGFLLLGAIIYHRFGAIGKFFGAFAFGYALGTLYVAITGKAITIPGFSSGG